MIKFFRKIRQKLLTENKFSKYLIYAIGEIVLVVIGILIALQINNWNEGKKNHQRESLILNEILNSINKDLKYFETVVDPLVDKKQKGLDSLEVYIFNKKTIQDSLFTEFYSNASQDLHLFFDNGPYDALKSSGLELISNDSLRSAINDVYAVRLPSFVNFAETQRDYGQSDISELKRNFLKLAPVNYTGRKKNGRFIPYGVKVDDILNNQDFLWVYNLERGKSRSYKFWLNMMKSELSNLRAQVEIELELVFGQQFTKDSSNRDLVFDSVDFQILERADDILSSELIWNKEDDRNCQDDIDSNKYSLSCALNNASLELRGNVDPFDPGLVQVRLLIQDQFKERLTNPKGPLPIILMDFNNHEKTSFDEIKRLLKQSIEKVEQNIN